MFREIVAAALKERGMSINWLAKASAIPQSSLSEWLAGRQASITSEGLERVFTSLDLSVTGRKKSRKISVASLSESR